MELGSLDKGNQNQEYKSNAFFCLWHGSVTKKWGSFKVKANSMPQSSCQMR